MENRMTVEAFNDFFFAYSGQEKVVPKEDLTLAPSGLFTKADDYTLVMDCRTWQGGRLIYILTSYLVSREAERMS